MQWNWFRENNNWWMCNIVNQQNAFRKIFLEKVVANSQSAKQNDKMRLAHTVEEENSIISSQSIFQTSKESNRILESGDIGTIFIIRDVHLN